MMNKITWLNVSLAYILLVYGAYILNPYLIVFAVGLAWWSTG